MNLYKLLLKFWLKERKPFFKILFKIKKNLYIQKGHYIYVFIVFKIILIKVIMYLFKHIANGLLNNTEKLSCIRYLRKWPFIEYFIYQAIGLMFE